MRSKLHCMTFIVGMGMVYKRLSELKDRSVEIFQSWGAWVA